MGFAGHGRTPRYRADGSRTGSARPCACARRRLRSMRFAHPAALLLLLLIPAILLLLRRRTAPRAIGFPTSGELARLRPSFAARLHAALPWLRALVLGLAVLALAGPQWGVETTRLLREGIAIAMVIDTSSSMSAIDLRLEDRPSDRLEVVKAAFREFVTGGASGVDGRSSDAIGMVTFARYADNITPPTLDHEALLGCSTRCASSSCRPKTAPRSAMPSCARSTCCSRPAPRAR